MSDKTIAFSALFAPDQVLCGLSTGRLDDTVHQLVASIGEIDRSVDIEAAYHLVLDREGCGVMQLQAEVAVVHVRIEGLKQLRIALAASREGFVCSHDQQGYECVGENFGPVNIAVLMMAPADDPAIYLRAVAALTKICQREGFIEQVLRLKHPEEVWESFAKTGERLPEYVEARHIMRTDFSSLHVSDSLCMAIDLFCREGTGEYPVVDADGDMVGIVSEDELIRLCLPEYITWMEDLSPVLNFEPFAEILRREKNMPVMEIMAFAEHYATVDESTPAIQVAKTMMRRDVRQVFVVRDKELMGIITIQDFIKKVLRA
ncbi:MAG: CBS domain-containing protein [Pseudomonadota bacterium]